MPVSRSTPEVSASLQSVLAQSMQDFEILIGDDGGQGERALELSDDPRVRYELNSPPRGFTSNHEALLARARGAFIAFLHDDDRWEATYLQRATAQLADSPRAGFVLSGHRESNSSAPAPQPAAGFHTQALPVVLDERYRILPSTTVIRRTALADVRSPWPRLACGDMVLYLDMAAAGWGLAVTAEALVHYARHPDQISADDTRFREDLATLFELYRFADPQDERLRRHRVASTRLSVARADLRHGRGARARVNLRRALAAERGLRNCAEGIALLSLSLCPPLLRIVVRAWYRIRGTPLTAKA
jgi:glycosyltransferase involved in cell wall biosynthesis